MKIHEYQAKELLAQAGAAIPRGIVASSPAEAVAAFDQFGGKPVVLKAQVHAGGRGKGKFKDSGKDYGGVKFITKRDDVIPYGPFLCLGALFVIVFWASVWNRVEFAFQLGWLMPAVLAICFVLLGVMLFIWQQIKLRLFAAGVEE